MGDALALSIPVLEDAGPQAGLSDQRPARGMLSRVRVRFALSFYQLIANAHNMPTDLLVYSLEFRNLVGGPSSKSAMGNLPPVLSPGIQDLWGFWKALSLIKGSGCGDTVGWRISWDFLSHLIPNLIKGGTAHALGESGGHRACSPGTGGNPAAAQNSVCY